MNLISKNIFLISILIISGCSSLDSLRFWQNDEIDPDEPKKLNSFSSQRDIKILWKNSFKGENDIGNFLPCLLYTSPSPRDGQISRMPSSA